MPCTDYVVGDVPISDLSGVCLVMLNEQLSGWNRGQALKRQDLNIKTYFREMFSKIHHPDLSTHFG